MFARRRKLLLGGGGLAMVLAIALATGIWYQFLRSNAPPPVSIEAAVAAMHRSLDSGTDPRFRSQAIQAGSLIPANTDVAPGFPGELSNRWEIHNTDGAFAGYRVTERLGSVDTKEVVGRTRKVEGIARFDRDRLLEASVTVDMTSLKSDQGLRDEALETQALETKAYPRATFELTEPVHLPHELARGQAVSVPATGEITIHGVTQQVEVPLEAQLSKGILVVVGTFPVELADFGITQSNAAFIASIKEQANVELQLFFMPS